jgi:hypothetical protein
MPLTWASSLLTSGLSCAFCVGLDSGLGMSMVLLLFGRKGMGVEGLELRN